MERMEPFSFGVSLLKPIKWCDAPLSMTNDRLAAKAAVSGGSVLELFSGSKILKKLASVSSNSPMLVLRRFASCHARFLASFSLTKINLISSAVFFSGDAGSVRLHGCMVLRYRCFLALALARLEKCARVRRSPSAFFSSVFAQGSPPPCKPMGDDQMVIS